MPGELTQQVANLLAQIFRDEHDIHFLLAGAGCPLAELPRLADSSPLAYWRTVLGIVEQGIIAPVELAKRNAPDGLAAVLQQACERRPGNPELAELLIRAQEATGGTACDPDRVRPPGPSGGRREPGTPSSATPLRDRPLVCVGRESLLKRLADLFLPPDESAGLPKQPLAGIGGIGKSTAVLWFIHDEKVKDRYGDRRHFIPLDGVTSREALVARMAEHLGVPLGPNLESRVMWFLEGGGRRLVVLDNAETPLLSEERLAVEEFLQHLARIAAVGLIATLRPDVPIGFGWREAIPVSRLDPPPARELFLSRTSGKFGADPDLDAFLGTLEGWPLVIRLAAERTKSYQTIKQFRGVWEKKRAELLKLGADRGTNFAVSVGLSLDHPRMTDSARRLLAIVARLPDGVRHGDLDGLLPGEGVEAAATLREVGGLVFDAGDRVRMLTPLRDHLSAALPFDGEDRTRVVGFYCQMAARRAFARSREWEALNVRLTTETENVRAMVLLGLELPDRAPAYLAMQGLVEFGLFTGLDFVAILLKATEAAHSQGDVRGEYLCVRGLGNVALRRSDHAEALKWYEHALTLNQQVGDVVGQAECVMGLGNIAFRRSDLANALEWYRQAKALFRQGEDLRGEASCVKRLGDIALALSDLAEASSQYRQAKAMFERTEDVLGEASCVKRLGDIALVRADHTEASRWYEYALALNQQVGDVLGEANCVKGLGDIALVARLDLVEAARWYGQAQPLYRQVGDVLGEANCVQRLGDTALEARSDHAEARARYEYALALYQRIEEQHPIGWANRRLARIASDPAERARFVAAAREAWMKVDRRDLIADLDDEFPPDPAARQRP